MIKNLSTKDSSRNRLQVVRKTFLTLCRKYAPHVLIIEKPFEFWENQSEYLKGIIREIKRLSKKLGIDVIEFSPKTVRKMTCQDERATKEQMAKAIAQSYPELKNYLDKGQKYNDGYWGRMVGSIALGICYLNRREKH
jgi:Holliday junction resolvasome RuvABC endonuclease subunit